MCSSGHYLMVEERCSGLTSFSEEPAFCCYMCLVSNRHVDTQGLNIHPHTCTCAQTPVIRFGCSIIASGNLQQYCRSAKNSTKSRQERFVVSGDTLVANGSSSQQLGLESKITAYKTSLRGRRKSNVLELASLYGVFLQLCEGERGFGRRLASPRRAAISFSFYE